MGFDLLNVMDWLNLSPAPSLLHIKKQLKKKINEAAKPPDLSALPEKDRLLIRHIRERTERLNRNNITRTTAYYDYYRRHPEVEWAFLGHMVSRNGGWNMTDLRGDLLPRLLSETEQRDFFQFLERGNWLIFQDAYPQFALYEESVLRDRNLFYLLPHFRVSAFMEVIWNHFWTSGDRRLLTIALVVNEQSYLEQRIIQNSRYRRTILETIGFKLQDLLSLNQIVFPCGRLSDDGTGPVELVGETLHRFGSLHERIMLGKRLYSLLFGQPEILQAAVSWAERHPHTGSRKDYWPHLFNDVNEAMPSFPYKKRIEHCRLKPGVPRLYSPKLQHAWHDVGQEAAEPGDWLNDWKIVSYLIKPEVEAGGRIADEYCQTLEKIELAVVAKTTIFERPL